MAAGKARCALSWARALAVRKGEFISLLGPSGCGKSTLLMMIAGLETPTAGRIELDGTLVAGPRRDIGIIFQDATLLPWKSALENVLLPVRILRRPVREHRDRARELLASVGLAGFENHKPGQLSGGMRQRVAICRALINDPEILLMDEPFSALDAITRDEMNELLVDLMERTAKTVVFVTHSIREAAFLSDRVLVMGGRPSGILLDETDAVRPSAPDGDRRDGRVRPRRPPSPSRHRGRARRQGRLEHGQCHRHRNRNHYCARPLRSAGRQPGPAWTARRPTAQWSGAPGACRLAGLRPDRPCSAGDFAVARIDARLHRRALGPPAHARDPDHAGIGASVSCSPASSACCSPS